jgi:hypothetical protein
MRCLRCAGAPRRPASGSGLSLTILSRHAILCDHGEFDIVSSRQRCRHRPSPKEQRLGTPKVPAIRFTRGEDFAVSTVHTFATACQFARHPVRIWPVSQPMAPFTSKLSTGQSPFPLLDMTTTSTGLLCWWDSHPLEWQLASLHAPHLPDAGRKQQRRFRSNPRSPSFRCDPSARDVALDPGWASAPCIAVPHMLPSSE